MPFVRLDCVDEVTALFNDCLSYMESHLELGDSDDEATSEEDEQQQHQQLHGSGEHRLSSRATSADRRSRDEQSSGGGVNTGSTAAAAVSLPAAPAVDSRGRLGLGSSSAVAAAGTAAGGEKVPVLPPAGLATKLIGSTVTRDYSSPSQSKRSLGGGVGSKRGSITLPSAVNLSGGSTGGAAATAVSPSSTSGVSPTSSASSGTPTLPPSASLTTSTSSSGGSSSSGSSSSPNSKLGLGLGLKGPGGLMSSNAAAQTLASSSSASAPAATLSGASAQSAASSTLTSGGPTVAATGSGGGPSAKSVGVGAGNKQIGLGHRPSSRAQYNAGAAAAAAAAQSTNEEELKEGASGGSGPSSGQNSDTDDEVIRVARPLGGAPKNKLLHRAAAGLASREYPSPKLGPRSLGASPAGMGPRGMSAPNNQQPSTGGLPQQQQQQQQLSSHQQRAPTLSHAASTGSAPSTVGIGGTDSFLAQPPSLSSPPSLGPPTFSSESDVDVLPEPSASLRDDDSNGGVDDTAVGGGGGGAAGGLILTEAVQFVKEKQLSDKEALNIPESAESEEKDLVDEALEKDPLQKLRNEVIVPVTASPKQYRSSLKLLTLAAESAHNSDGTVTPPDAAEPLPLNSNGTQPTNANDTAELSLHRLNPLLSAASLPSSMSSSSPTHSASNTPKPAFLRRLDSPESHHGQLIAAKAKLQMLINRAMQTIPQLKKDSLPAVHARLEAALAKLEASTIQP